MISAEYEKYIVGLHQDLEKQKIDLEKQIKEEKDPAKKDELQSQLKALKSPKLKESIALLNDPTQKEQAKKGFKVNLVGLLYQHYELNEQPAKKSLSAALNVTHEGFNDWLAKNTATIIQNFSLSGGIGLDKQGDHYQPVLGLAATVSGKQGLREGGSLIYAGGVGAGRNGNWAVGPFVALGVEQQILSGTSNKKIDAGAAHYLGIIGNASAAGLGVSAYWRRDKLEGIENQSKKVQGKFSEIITQATTLQPNESLTIKGIEAQLKKQYPDQKGSLLPFASDIYTALKPYEEILKTEKNTPARQRVIDQLAYHMTTHWLNNNTAKLTEKFRHLSGIALGAQFVTGWYPMPTMGLSFTKYKNLSYTDSLESLNRAAETLTQGYGADQIKGMSFGEMADNLNATLQRRYASTENAGESVEKTDQTKYLEYDSANNIVKINKKILEKVNLHILPVLKQFVAHQN
ncbi:MAG: hypothetical protein LBD11_04635 [Candidatus Peribacteria bacterium]|jgi:hypothetical protein|nr:hypothetical protein [Candidatus Peribacteria bacterium]